MIRHLFRIVWNRRRRNGLILVEILASFLILCALFTAVSSRLVHWGRPLGFDYENVWQITVDFGPFHALEDEAKLEIMDRLRAIEREISNREDVVAVGMTANLPYSPRRVLTVNCVDGTEHEILYSKVRPSSLEALRLVLVEGRWFEPQDEIQTDRLVVLSRDYARLLFGDESPIGKLVPELDEDGRSTLEEGERPSRVIGVVRPYRRDGEHRPATLTAFEFLDWTDPDTFLPGTFALRTQPDAPAGAEQEILELIRRMAPDWTPTIDRLEDLRAREIRMNLIPVAVLGVVAAFLVIMVGLGLIGVLWQSVARRTGEIGLRRALGATASGVRAQILGELLALATIAMAIGTAIYLQFPLLGVIDEPWSVVGLALATVLAVMYGFVLLCGLYPSWLATRIEPARALMYE